MSVQVRTATVRDAEAIEDLLSELHAHYGRAKTVSIQRRTRFAYFPDGEVSSDAPILAVLDGLPVGLVTFGVAAAYADRPSYAFVREFCVAERFRGQGIGRALLAEVRERATARGCEHVEWGGKAETTPDTLERTEMYCESGLLGFQPDPAQARRKQRLRELAAESGWAAPTIVNHRDTMLEYGVGDVLAEGEVPFAILGDGRLVRARFRTLCVAGYYTKDEETRWTLLLDGEPLRVATGSALLAVDSEFARGERLPERTRPHPGGGEAVRYDYFYGHHLGWTTGHLTYVIDAVARTVSVIEELTFDPD
ncbi:GNAT family N-acetyltransferase [Nocardia sp. NPDC050406]|uniref:GNAT family N-acetyltransferase n=1 Tax=Nocardia sp. NPDC050406 TaxID=3364318 RepID=UPI00378ADE1B